MSFLSAKPMRASVGADSAGPSYNVTSLSKGNIEIAVLTTKTMGFPVWAYAREVQNTSFTFEVWLYLARVGIPIYSVQAGKWTSVSKYVSQFTADMADASLISTVDVSKGGVLRSGDKLFVDEPLGISEVELNFSAPEFAGNPDGGEDTAYINISAAKGGARTAFTPFDIFQSLKTTSLGFSPQETKPPVGAPPIPEPPTKLPTKPAAPAPKPFPTEKWVMGGLTLGGLLWALGRRP